jgi:hypothetical protein
MVVAHNLSQLYELSCIVIMTYRIVEEEVGHLDNKEVDHSLDEGVEHTLEEVEHIHEAEAAGNQGNRDIADHSLEVAPDKVEVVDHNMAEEVGRNQELEVVGNMRLVVVEGQMVEVVQMAAAAEGAGDGAELVSVVGIED